MSEQQNPQELLQSLQRQQPTLAADITQSDSKPFSIRQYVLDSRQKDIIHSWPFPEKYLRIFLSRGIRTVLPPFEPHLSAIRSLRKRPPLSNLSQLKNGNVAGGEKVSKEVCDPSKTDEAASEICSRDRNGCGPNVGPCDGAVSSGKRMRIKRKRGKWKHYKKRKSIVNILDATKKTRCCLSENVPGIEECKGTSNGGEHGGCESEVTEEKCSKNKLVMNECQGADTEMSRMKRRVLSYELENCSLRSSGGKDQGGERKKALPQHRNGSRLHKS